MVPGRRRTDILGLAVALIFLGAILRYAITAEVAGIDINALGSILMVAGLIALAIVLVLLVSAHFGPGRHREVVRERETRERGPL